MEQSCYLKENFAVEDGKPPKINFINEKNNGEIVLKLIKENFVLSSHDISSGGLLVALSEMSIGSKLGAKINKPKKLVNLTEYFFGEDQSRYILEIHENSLPDVDKILKKNNIYYENIGITQDNYFEIEGEMKIDINDLFKINNQWYNNF